METIEYRKKIDETYNTDQSVLFRWEQTEKFLEPKELLNAGLDIGERTALTKRLEDLYNINFDSTNIDLDIEPLKGEYDIITSFEVLEHLFNPLFNLIEIKRVLKPNGVLYISTPLYKPRIIKSPYHFHEFSEDELMNLIKRADFLVKRKKIIKVRPFWHYFLGIRPMLRAKYERVILLELSVE